MEIQFLGATGTVTGSKYLVTSGSRRILVDCGLFQGFKQLRLRNWAPLPVEAHGIDDVVLTHAHLDHSGYVPRLAKSGFRGRVIASPGTLDLCHILLPDSGRIQEEDAAYANRKGFSRHHPARALYTERDARVALRRFVPLPFESDLELDAHLTVRLRRAGHIVGASFVALQERKRRLVFSGDLGRAADPVMLPPEQVSRADFLVVESTYGDRRHPDVDPASMLEAVIRRTAERGGTVLIPAFAVGRTQAVLHLLASLLAAGRIPRLPVFLDSPMATEATSVFLAHGDEHRLSAAETRRLSAVARFVSTVEESKRLMRRRDPRIVIAASGMATGGRVLHHLTELASDARNTILFTGYQAGGTRGAALLGGAKSVKIHGQYVRIEAEVAVIDNLSAHADADGILAWLRGFEAPPATTFVTHGEPAAADALRHRIEEELGWSCVVPDYRERVRLR